MITLYTIEQMNGKKIGVLAGDPDNAIKMWKKAADPNIEIKMKSINPVMSFPNDDLLIGRDLAVKLIHGVKQHDRNEESIKSTEDETKYKSD